MTTFNLQRYLTATKVAQTLPATPANPVAPNPMTPEQFRELRLQIAKVMMNEIGLDMGSTVALKPATPEIPAWGQIFSASYRTGGLAEHSGDVDSLYSDIGALRGESATIQTSFGMVLVNIQGVDIGKASNGEAEDGDGEFQVDVKFIIAASATLSA